MKYHILLYLLASFFCVTTSAFAEKEDTRRPTWIERLFGAKDPSEVAKDEKSDRDNTEVEEAEKNEGAREEAKEKQEKTREKSKTKREFTEEEREVLESWRQGNANWKQSNKPLPPGLRKKVARGGELPPGWKKKLGVGAVLDPELDAQASSLPEEILRRLPESEEGTEILRIGDEIIRVIENSREIVDILGGTGGRDVEED